ncbi:MAG: TetR/AcrR family transcriptional regulator [Bacteroidales bacterium]|nr:TetR/AcrR family transcriptional regulator [Candidatus Physcousia equi]
MAQTALQIRTRNKLVDVARQLFARKGLDDTTMNNIAMASEKGRRTLYTYFKNKEDIYFAVIEAEMERLTETLNKVAQQDLPPVEKVVEIIYAHLRLIKEAVLRNGNLRAEFFRNIWLVEKVRRNFDHTEVDLLTQVLTNGVKDGLIEVDNIPLAVDIIHYCTKGLEVPYIHGRLGEGMGERMSKPMVKKLVDRAIGNS